MDKSHHQAVFFTILTLLITLLPSNGLVDDKGPVASNLKTYIIQVAPSKKMTITTAAARKRWYISFLPKALHGSREARLVYPYNEAFSGFAARLTDRELKEMEKVEGFVRAIPDKKLAMHTTHTPAFLGLRPGQGLWRPDHAEGYGEGVIIGVIDSGFSPGHPSFDDNGMPSRPTRFRGRCDSPDYCNNKVIGARSFTVDNVVDVEGHGTHTASIAAGSAVTNTSVFGLANGTASGMAPRAHLSIYKVCSYDYCYTSNVLAGMDAAISDGVDILSISLGGLSVDGYYNDPIAIASFAATRRGILVSCSAGNDGPLGLSNDAPWILTVGASTVDRRLRATVLLGNGQEFEGESAFQNASASSGLRPLVFLRGRYPDATYCDSGSLDGINVTGKIVVCKRGGYNSRVEKGEIVKRAGGAGMILLNRYVDDYTTLAEAHVLPALSVSYADATKITSYIAISNDPTATITRKGTVLGTEPAPAVASFSSKGPSNRSSLLLKPDVIAPGVSVVAGWPLFQQPPAFNLLSGTSMSAPHLSGIAALLKGTHLDWSPSAIKSAVVTTAYTRDRSGNPIKNEHYKPATMYEMGAGHVDANAAADPGLVYETGEAEYIRLLCGLGYNNWNVTSVVGEPVNCTSVGSAKQWELNYPSITVPRQGLPLTVTRTVTNVGDAHEDYVVQVDAPAGTEVVVEPRTLNFTHTRESKSFNVTFLDAATTAGLSSGSLKWVSRNHVVRSPIVVYV